mmetsp:Transcript_12440/g.32961  ORF Transcript_12440/g.32961 Transcript_12440/m.32961 type:complete len:230 (+) Transcript_12440:494-1183(+)
MMMAIWEALRNFSSAVRFGFINESVASKQPLDGMRQSEKPWSSATSSRFNVKKSWFSAAIALNRFLGSLCSSPLISDCASGEILVQIRPSILYFPASTRSSVSCLELPKNGYLPVSMFHRITPHDHMSTGGPYDCFRRISGATNAGVPTMLRCRASSSSSKPESSARERPKSASMQCRGKEEPLQRTFSDLRSRWTTPWSCKYWTPEMIWCMASAASFSENLACMARTL